LSFLDIEPVRPEAKVVEAEGAKYTGIVVLLLSVLPLGILMMSLDVLKIVKWRKKRNKRHKHT